jgi:hypothetical protein
LFLKKRKAIGRISSKKQVDGPCCEGGNIREGVLWGQMLFLGVLRLILPLAHGQSFSVARKTDKLCGSKKSLWKISSALTS